MDTSNLSPASDASVGAWIEPELTGSAGSVTALVPACFQSFARIFHPAEASDGTYVTWEDVAVVLGSMMHARRQWHVLVGSSDPYTFRGSGWNGSPPEEGDLVPEIFDPLCDVLGRHTSDPGRCFFGLWTGLSWDVVRSVPAEMGSEGNTRRSVSRSVDEIKGPRLRLPGREYVLLLGSLSAAGQIREREDEIGSGLAPTSPNLMWPADRAWFLATEIDFDSTLVGGSADLIEAVLAAEELEAWPVARHDSLTFDGDDDGANPREEREA